MQVKKGQTHVFYIKTISGSYEFITVVISLSDIKSTQIGFSMTLSGVFIRYFQGYFQVCTVMYM